MVHLGVNPGGVGVAMAEFGLVAARGAANVAQLRRALAQYEGVLPALVEPTAELLFGRIEELNAQLGALDRQIRSMVREHEELRRLMTIPGVGPICAMAVYAFAPTMETFGRGRDFAAWVGLTPRETSTAGRQRLGRITRMGQRDVRQLYQHSGADRDAYICNFFVYVIGSI